MRSDPPHDARKGAPALSPALGPALGLGRRASPRSAALPAARRPLAGALATGALLLSLAPPAAAEPALSPEDPYNSAIFPDRRDDILGDGARVLFDPRVRVDAPASAEDSFNTPVSIDAAALGAVEKIVVFVDWGPIPEILTFHPGRALPKLSLRFKIDQSTPVRAAALTADGIWHVGSARIDAAGGGCTAPAAAYAADGWEEHVGEVQGALWPETGRLRMIVDHPMDTGLADGIPVYIIEELELSAPDGSRLARLELHEPVNEDPAFTLHFPPGAMPQTVALSGRDNNGGRISATLREAMIR